MKVLAISILYIYFVSGYPTLNVAIPCATTHCKIEENCRCSSTVNPINSETDPAPQLISITVSESIVTTLFDNYLKPILFNRKNPDGKPIGATFYINHEYTDYELVQELYLRGYEIGVHSITKNASQEYWRLASKNDLVEEFGGQRQIISHFANIPIGEVLGARTPQLQLEGDLSINAYIESGIIYDNSWPTRSTELLLPYTLDYASSQECSVTINCPKNSHPGFWIAPITNIEGRDDVECNSLATCLVTGTAEEIADWLVHQVDHVHYSNRAPLVLRLDSYWFNFIQNSLEGFQLFLDRMEKRNDVFFISVKDIIDWMKYPIPAINYTTPLHQKSAICNPQTCRLNHVDGSERYMRSCVECPEVYPWKGNPLGLRVPE